MFTTWEQVKEWIVDNNFPHWVFYKKNPEERDNRDNDTIIDSNHFTVSDFNDKLDMTEKYLRMYGGKCYGVGFKAPQATTSGVVCEVKIMEAPAQQGTSGIGGASIGELTEMITKQVRAEIEAENYKRERDNFAKEKAEFEKEKQSAVGALVHYFAPIGQMIMKNKFQRSVAGLDASAPVEAEPIQPIVSKEPEQPTTEEPESDFTEEEEQEIYDLLARFKKVEPQYLALLRSVVAMAESGDSTYTMARGFLIK